MDIENAGQSTLTVERPRLADIAPIFNLIQNCSRQGVMNGAYLVPRFQAGLALQLLMVYFFGRIRLSDGAWFATRLYIGRREGRFSGFALARQFKEPGTGFEIYLFAIAPDERRRGHGRLLLQAVLDDLGAGNRVQASCLPGAIAMERLLCSLKFQPLPKQSRSERCDYARKPGLRLVA
ncbi:MAG TPA: hypothetical protein DCW29_02585 [Janthinobacterium sp.]|nr:hypothetical protein [Janthinobacterium sp.]